MCFADNFLNSDWIQLLTQLLLRDYVVAQHSNLFDIDLAHIARFE